MTVPGFEYIATLEIAVGAPVEVGAGHRMIPVLGGKVHGPRLNGTILPGGADWQRQEAGDMLRIGGRWVMETDDHVRVQVETPGIRRASIRRASSRAMSGLQAGHDVDSTQVYFRLTLNFIVEHESYEWLRQTIFIGLGTKRPQGVEIEVFALA